MDPIDISPDASVHPDTSSIPAQSYLVEVAPTSEPSKHGTFDGKSVRKQRYFGAYDLLDMIGD